MIIGIAGGSGSGKTTFTKKIIDIFGENVSVIYYDNYYKSQNNLTLEERSRTNYDHPNQLDTDLLISHLHKLKLGEKIKCPLYDFSLHTRSKETIVINPTLVIIVEGILTFYDERLRNLMDLKIYVDTDADERVLRRVKRDIEERGRDIHGVIKQYLMTVKPMHELFVEPTKNYADIIINGGLNDRAFDVIKTKIQCILNTHKN